MNEENTGLVSLIKPGDVVKIIGAFQFQFDREICSLELLVESVKPGSSWNPSGFWIKLTTNDAPKRRVTGKLESQIEFPAEWFGVVGD